MLRRIVLLLLAATSASGASSYPPSYEWRTYETEHFLVHFHQGEEALSRRAGAIAEDVHARLSPLMRWIPQERTHLVLTDNVDVSNGSATTFPRNRIEVYVSAPGGDPSSPLAYYDDWLDLVITHEYAHILHLDQARALPGTLRRILGRNPIGFPNAFAPLWMIEGLATYVESHQTDAGRVKGTFTEMVLRAAAVENRWPTEAQAGGLTAHWPGGSARYFFGSKFIDWLARRHGHDAVALYFKEYSERLIFNINASAREVFGKSIPALWEEWSREQQAAYRAELERMRATLTPAQRITSLGYETKHPSLSPDGTRIAYAHRGPFERPTIRVMDLATGRDIDTHRVHTTSPLSWSPDGTAIAYADLEYHGSFAILSDLYLWRVGDRRERRLTRGARLKDPAFTQDGRALIAVQNEAGRNRIVQVDIATGSIKTLMEPDDYRQFSEPHVSGDRYAVAEWKEGRIDIVTYSLHGGQLANLTQSFPRSINAAPRFTSDGTQIVFTSDVNGIANIFAADANGRGAPRRLTNVFGGAFFPTTRDGETIWFAEYHANGFDLARANVTRELETTPRALPPPVTRTNLRFPDPAALTVSKPYSPRRSALPTWWSPILSGTAAGITTSGGDVLGFHQYSATITNEFQSAVYLYDRWYPTLTLAGVRYDEDVIGFRTAAGIQTFTSDNKRFLAQISAPFRRIDHQLIGWIGGVRDEISGDPPGGVADSDLTRNGVFRGSLQGIRIGGAFNNTHRHGFSISPENGITARIDYENLGGDAELQQTRADLRGYLAIPWRRSPLGRHVVAARVAGGRQSGDFILQKELRVGGVGEGEFLGIDSRNFPVRGYDSSTLRGNRATIASLEYRVPLFEIDRGPSTWPLFFNRVVADVFVDAGRARRRTGQEQTIASTGVEIALDTFLGYFLPVRYRIGVAYRLRDPGKGDVEPFIALESAF
jgi:Tol biopolymer transport system component